MEFRPSIAKLQLHLLAPFFAGVLMSSWVWTSSTVETWKRFIRRYSHPFSNIIDQKTIKISSFKQFGTIKNSSFQILDSFKKFT